MKTNFNLVSIEANRFIQKMIAATNTEDASHWYGKYLNFLKMNGWTEEEFDDHMLAGIDNSWQDKKKIN